LLINLRSDFGILIVVLAIHLLLPGCGSKSGGEFEVEKMTSESGTDNMHLEGFELAKKFCVSCHAWVSPDKLPKEYWKTVLLRMSAFLGFKAIGDPFYGDTPLAIHRLDSVGIFPPEPVISNEAWQKLVLYYLENAPETLDQGHRPTINLDQKQFGIYHLPIKAELHGPTFIKILADQKIAAGYYFPNDSNVLKIIDLSGNELYKNPLPSALAAVASGRDGTYLACMGPFVADDTPTGSILKVDGDLSSGFNSPISTLLSNLERPVHINLADINQDDREDIISAEFGKFLGGLYVYIQDSLGAYQKKTLYNRPGVLSTVLRDVNNDQLPDIYALVSQDDEGVYLFINKGQSIFETRKILDFPPYFGSVHFEMIDFDRDGLEDIIYSNGDSGDFGSPAKPFHGIRYFRKSGNFQFEEKWFYPQQGTYKTCVVDFDQDGDYDLASIGFFASKAGFAGEGFLYLENIGGNQFETYSFTGAAESSYLVMDSGDLDGDGDIDLVLGASTSHLSVPEMVNQLMRWQFNAGSAVTILENTTR
jgi:hypothetical protein